MTPSLAGLSVVLVNWNGRPFIDRCLDCLQRDLETLPDTEIVVVDNASTDDSVEHLRRTWPDVRVIDLDANVGFAAGCNLGARAAAHDVVVFLNTDAFVEPGWAMALLIGLADRPHTVIAGGLALFDHDPSLVNSAGVRVAVSGAGTDLGFEQHLDQVPIDERDVAAISGVSMAADREWFLATGGFDERFFMYFEDVELCLRAWLEGRRVRFCGRARVFHAFGGSAGSRLSPTRNFYGSRNRLLTVLKLWTPASVPLSVLLSIVQDIVTIVSVAARGNRRLAVASAIAKIRGIAAAWRHPRVLYAVRRSAQRRLVRTTADLRHQGLIDPLSDSLREFARFKRL